MPAGSGSLESLRGRNRVRVVDALRRHGLLSRADLARVTGLSRSTISTLVADLQDRGFVEERTGGAAPRAPVLGRPPVLLQLARAAGVAVGLAFDHVGVRVVLADLSHVVLAEADVAADVDEDAQGALEAAVRLVQDAVAAAGAARDEVLAAGVALPGPVDQAGGRARQSYILPGWAGIDAAAELAGRLGVPVHVDNDANLGALAEATHGAARGGGATLYVQLSSGVGAGLVVDGRPYRGARGVAGELGHVVVDERGPLCRCGNRGCLEAAVSGSALARLVSESRGQSLTARQVLALARDGDVGCRRAVADAGSVVGRVVGNACNFWNPDTVVVGGELGAAGELLLGPLRDAVLRTGLPDATDGLRVVAGELGERAAVLGALSLALAHSEEAMTTRLDAVPAV